MMRSHLTLFTASIFAALLFGASSLRAQEKPTAPTTPKNLAIEIVGRDNGVPFPVLESSQGGLAETSPPKRLPNWKQPPGVIPLTRIRIRSTFEGEGVRIKVAGAFDDSELPDASGPKYGEKEEALASYFAREGETVTVEELARFGIEPMLLRVVRASPRRDEPVVAVTQPLIVNPLQAVTVLSFESDATRPTHYNLTLRNLSAKSIIALKVHSTQEGGGGSQSVQGMPEHPLMPPGAMYQIEISVNNGGRWTPQGFVPDTRQQTWEIGTVIFADGTYEGEMKTAAEYAAAGKGRRVQLARALRLFQQTLAAPEQDATVVLEKLKSQVSTLRIDVEASIVDELLAHFPQLSANNDRAWLMATVMSGLKNGREEALFRLKDLEEARTRNAENFNFQQSLRAINQQLARQIGTR